MRSAIYSGIVTHARFRPKVHRLRYRVFMLLLDLDEVDGVASALKLFAHNRFGLMSLHDRDHADRVAAPLRPQVEARLAKAGIAFDLGRVELLSMPRLFGRAFNPLSLYFCYDREDALRAIVYQVANTFGERHDYVLATPRGPVRQTSDKQFFVSPFMEMGLGYAFEVSPPGEAVRVAIRASDAQGELLTAAFSAKRSDLTDAGLLRAWIGHPWQTVGVLAAIHWEAIKILLKGIPYVGRGGRKSRVAAPMSHAG